MRLSVIICTRHRQASLQRLLRSIAACHRAFDEGDWEIVVVDNGEPDCHATVHPGDFVGLPLRLVHEHQPGLSHARNRGARAGRGSWLLWTDDDVTVSPQWLATYREAIDAYPHAAVLGGPIRASLEGSPPDWLSAGQNHVRSAFASREPDDVGDTFEACGPLPYGANFAIRRSDALRFPFSPTLGRHPRRPTRGWEEVFVIERILSCSGTGRWLRDAEVTHHIDASRQTESFIRAYYFDVGFVTAMRKATRMQSRRGMAMKLVRAISLGLRLEAALVIPAGGMASRQRALLLRDASRNWGRARAWVTALLDARVLAAWRESCCA